MRFEELAYSVDGLPVTVTFRAGLTVVPVPENERDDWVARLFGVLEGVRAGDGSTVAYVDEVARRFRLRRDDHGAATLTDEDERAEMRISAAHLSLDGRFDWFASIGITSGTAVTVAVVESVAFTDADWDPAAVEAELQEIIPLAARAERQLQAATARCSQVDDLRRRIATLDSQTDGGLGVLARSCQVAAQRRDELIDRLDELEGTGQGEGALLLPQLIEEVEPALVDALAALAAACRPYDVVIDATRIEAFGVSAAGIAALVAGALAEAAGDVNAAERSQLVEELERCEWDLPHVEHLTARRSALQLRVAELEASLRAGHLLPSVADVETALVDRADRALRVGRHRESLPLVIKAALDHFDTDDKRSLLDVVARLADTVQVVYLTDDPETLAWAAKRATTEQATTDGPSPPARRRGKTSCTTDRGSRAARP
jgi:hypothetical protein